jgi:peptide/nickel transport system permease protein
MSRVSDLFEVLKHNRKALFGFLVLLGFFLMATVGRVIIPLNMDSDYSLRFRPPSLHHPFGTDYAGRDTFALIVHGSRDVLIIAFSTGFFAVLIAILVGMFAGLSGGWIDILIMRLIDILLTIPQFPVMAIFAALFRITDSISFGLVLAVWTWPVLASAIRAQVLSLKNKEFIEVCFLMDLPQSHIIFRELLPNMVPFIAVNFINICRGAITASVGIMLLGLVPLSVTNWGMMLNLATVSTGAIFVPQAFGYLFAPIFCIVLLQYGLICFASGIEEIFDPRLGR